jgi:hypothetical protein
MGREEKGRKEGRKEERDDLAPKQNSSSEFICEPRSDHR